MKIEFCKNCGDSITFAINQKKRRIALNPDEVAGGEYELRVGVAGTPVVIPIESNVIHGYVAHSTTCPNARKLRKRDRVRQV